ncbi:MULTISPECIES: HAD family hydrolase [unclassified Streptococcus]|uniref:HAD family hydrolase n=1 Tax=unclassified Streptococcus TaxID=2608887 RepID=UPI0010725E82|nr:MULTISPECIES: HAD-IA family hydrolase [unclassified Streptococcus]MBF0786995.1 HAD family hydrolase [Streptococcus sp. 19428wC2_LYSM12]MCQ9212607.1 HAD-IA family hydrolase [Streptococcus sp. B01]MCQ9213946.1 HAD-IA family hydrolase [Streptococcus sp. O1]TFV06033.1 HAD family hydrolase [Streptococcus sp. LYSM12]
MIKGILFDKDGTILDFFALWQPAIKPVLERLMADYGVQPQEEYLPVLEEAIGIKNGQIDPEGAIAWKPYDLIAQDVAAVVKTVVPDLELKDLSERLENYFGNEIACADMKEATFTDMKSLFQQLRERGIFIGIVTTDTFQATWKCMNDLELTSFISFLGASDNGLPVKPDRSLLQKVATLWECHPAEIMVVGDTPNDMRFAKNGHALAVGVTSGVGTVECLSAYTPYVIPSLADLLPLLERLERNRACQ